MAKKILVPMKRNDRVDDFIPYVENVARAGMQVVFMVPYPVDGYRWSNEESGRKAIKEGMKLAAYYNFDTNRQKAKAQVSAATRAITDIGVDVVTEVYAGNVSKAIRAYAAKGDVQMIVTRASIGQRIAGFLSGTSLLGAFTRQAKAPMLLVQPGMAA